MLLLCGVDALAYYAFVVVVVCSWCVRVILVGCRCAVLVSCLSVVVVAFGVVVARYCDCLGCDVYCWLCGCWLLFGGC